MLLLLLLKEKKKKGKKKKKKIEVTSDIFLCSVQENIYIFIAVLV